MFMVTIQYSGEWMMFWVNSLLVGDSTERFYLVHAIDEARRIAYFPASMDKFTFLLTSKQIAPVS